MSAAQRTAGAWSVGRSVIVYDDHGAFVASCDTQLIKQRPQDQANAAFIVEACNAHDALVSEVAALREALEVAVVTLHEIATARPGYMTNGQMVAACGATLNHPGIIQARAALAREKKGGA